jgi:hypothetical protein
MAAQTVDQNAIMSQQVDKRRLPPQREIVLVKIVLSSSLFLMAKLTVSNFPSLTDAGCAEPWGA